jgi:hypothetical protein
MSERSEEVKLAIMIGVTIAFVWKAIEFFSAKLTKLIVDLWKDGPAEATELMGFIIITVIFIIVILVFVIRGRE